MAKSRAKLGEERFTKRAFLPVSSTQHRKPRSSFRYSSQGTLPISTLTLNSDDIGWRLHAAPEASGVDPPASMLANNMPQPGISSYGIPGFTAVLHPHSVRLAD